jgi:site-specific DNA recombinase
MPAALIFCRVSDPHQQQRNEANLPAQEKRCQDWCKANSLPVLRVFVAEGESAWETTRPVFEEALDFVQQNKGRVTHFVVQDVSRFSRNIMTQAAALGRLRKLGVTLVSVDEPSIDDTPVGQLMSTILGGVSEFQSHSQSHRIRRRMQVGREAGRWLHMAPLGYLNKDKTLIHDPELAPLVRQCFELVAEGQYTCDHVRKLMTAAGLRTKKGKALSRSTFSTMLKTTTYYGIIKHDGKEYAGSFVPLVSPELWQQVQRTLAGKKKAVPRIATSEQWPLRGFVKCASCGQKLTSGSPRGRGGKQYPRYWCFNPDCTNPVSVSKQQLEDDWLELLRLTEPTADALVNILPKMAKARWKHRQQRLSEQDRVLNVKLEDQQILNLKLTEAQLRGELSKEHTEQFREHTSKTIAGIEEARAALASEATTMEKLVEDTRQQFIDLPGTWQKAGLREKQELQAALFQSGLVYNEEQRFMILNQNQELAEMVFAGLLAIIPGEDLIEVESVQSGRGEWI